MSTEAIAKDRNEIGDNDPRIVDDANVMELNVGCDWSDVDRCTPAYRNSKREYRKPSNIHKTSPVMANA